jgi:hypothetical protein
MSASRPRSDRSARDAGSKPPSEEFTPTRQELETLLAMAEDRALDAKQLAVAERLHRDPRARGALQRQRSVAAALRAGGPAPSPTLAPPAAAKTARVTDPRSRTLARRGWPVKLIAVTAAVTAAIALVASAIIGASSSGPSARPTAAQVATVWTLPTTGRRVAADRAHPTQLDISYHGIVYPNYHDHEGWHPVAARYDRIGGLPVATVFYQTARRRAAYTVVPATGLAVPAHARRLRVGGLSLREFRSGDRWIVTFEKHGNTCVLTAAAPRERRWLIRLAAWQGGPAVAQARLSAME